MFNLRFFSLAAPVLLLGAAAAAPPYQPQYQNQQGYDHQHQNNFYNGVRQGGQGGQYYDPNDHRYDNNNGDYHQGGIGPGKGAAIGGAGGAVLGAVFGGGLKGALIGGAAGAGIGAIAGKAHQDDQRRDNGYHH